MRERFWQIVGALLLATLGITAMAIAIIGLPFASWKLSAAAGGGAVRVVLFLLVALLFIAGPLLTLGPIFTPLPFLAINLLAALIFSLLLPYAALAQTLLYFDLQARAGEEPAKPRRRLTRRLRPAPAEG